MQLNFYWFKKKTMIDRWIEWAHFFVAFERKFIGISCFTSAFCHIEVDTNDMLRSTCHQIPPAVFFSTRSNDQTDLKLTIHNSDRDLFFLCSKHWRLRVMPNHPLLIVSERISQCLFQSLDIFQSVNLHNRLSDLNGILIAAVFNDTNMNSQFIVNFGPKKWIAFKSEIFLFSNCNEYVIACFLFLRLENVTSNLLCKNGIAKIARISFIFFFGRWIGFMKNMSSN